VGPTTSLFVFPTQANTVSAEKLNACTVFYIYITFGHWGVRAAFDMSNIRPLKVNVLVMLVIANNLC
jgi:hypothetical protein